MGENITSENVLKAIPPSAPLVSNFYIGGSKPNVVFLIGWLKDYFLRKETRMKILEFVEDILQNILSWNDSWWVRDIFRLAKRKEYWSLLKNDIRVQR